ncbi:MAG: DinB family protein [Chloroflexi bacterium]|nr:DinB family protein [Chloroflexota bacterium]
MAELLTYDEDTAFMLADDAATISAIVRRTPVEKLRAHKVGDWTAVEVIGHLADGSEIFADRVGRCIEEEQPTLRAFDQDRLARDRRNAERDPMELSRRLQRAHQQIVQLLQRPGATLRTGVHTQLGVVTAGHCGAYEAKHAHEHTLELAKAFPPS